MSDTSYLPDEDETQAGPTLAELMEKKGISRPVLPNSADLPRREGTADPEKKIDDFLARRFSSSPESILENALGERDLERIRKTEYDLVERIKSSGTDQLKSFLENACQRYHSQRAEIYTLISMLRYGAPREEEIAGIAAQIAELSVKNIVLREVVQYLGIKIYQFTGTAKFNERFSEQGLLLSVAEFSFNRGVKVVCPRCGNLVETVVMDFGSHYHSNAAPFITGLHGKLSQDCKFCSWYFFYDLDAVTGFPGIKTMLSEEPKIKIESNSADRIVLGEVSSKNSISFLLPLGDSDTREELLSRWHPLLGGNKLPVGIAEDKTGTVLFNSQSYGLRDSDKQISGIALGLVLNHYVMVTISLRASTELP